MSSLIADIRQAMRTNPFFNEMDRVTGSVPSRGGGWFATYQTVAFDRRIGVSVRVWACPTDIPDVEEVALGIVMKARSALLDNLACADVGLVERVPDHNPLRLDSPKAATMLTKFVTFEISVVGMPSGQGVS